MDPVDIVDEHGPIPPPAKPAALLTGNMLGNTPSAFHKGQKLLAEHLHAAMNLQYRKSIEPVKTPPALQNETDKYPMPPDLMKDLKLTKDETDFFRTHGYCVLKKTREKNEEWFWGYGPLTKQLCMTESKIDRVIPARRERKAEGNDKIHVHSWRDKFRYHTTIWDKSLSWEDLKKKLDEGTVRWMEDADLFDGVLI